MSTYVYRRAGSTGARELAEALGGVRWKGVQVPMGTKARAGDFIVCWGETLAPLTGIQILNGAAINNKFTDAMELQRAGVPTIQVSRTRPTAATTHVAPTGPDPARSVYEEAIEAAVDFQEVEFLRTNPVFVSGVRDFSTLLQRLSTALATPIPVPRPVAPAFDGAWVGRDNDHTGGIDLLNPTAAPDYWVRKETLTNEFRIHSFLGRSIRAGKKAHRENFTGTRSAWVRSWDGGWRIVYDGVSANQAQRDLAHRAVAALGLQFGAVDIGQKADGTLIVLEVNRAPGLEGGTITSYRDAVRHWMAGEWTTTNQAATRPARRRRAA